MIQQHSYRVLIHSCTRVCCAYSTRAADAPTPPPLHHTSRRGEEGRRRVNTHPDLIERKCARLRFTPPFNSISMSRQHHRSISSCNVFRAIGSILSGSWLKKLRKLTQRLVDEQLNVLARSRTMSPEPTPTQGESSRESVLRKD